MGGDREPSEADAEAGEIAGEAKRKPDAEGRAMIPAGRIISLNVGMPRNRFVVRGQPVSTAIYKEPVSGPVALRDYNLEGDRQADLRAHGGPDKAVYGYPSEHYPFWQREFPEMPMSWGVFGENLTTEGLIEDEVQIGDRFRLGSAVIEVAQPRYPCFKLAMKFGAPDMVKRFLHSERCGFYFRIVEEGVLQAGDAVEFVPGERSGVPVRDVIRLTVSDDADRGLIARVLEIPNLPFFWKERILEQSRH